MERKQKRSQADILLEVLQDGKPHSTPEILERVYGGSHLGIARISARVWDLNQRLHGRRIVSKRDEAKPTVFWYSLVTDEPKQRGLFDGTVGVA